VLSQQQSTPLRGIFRNNFAAMWRQIRSYFGIYIKKFCNEVHSVCRCAVRIGLKPMQLIGPHASGGSAIWYLGRLFVFAGYYLRLRTQQKRLINLIASKQFYRLN